MSFTYPIDHRQLVPGLLVDRKQGYFSLPSFLYTFNPPGITFDSTKVTIDSTTVTVDNNNTLTNTLAWSGASVIVAQYNYTSTNNFILTELPEPPDDVNFCLVIRYRVGDKITRFKLWENVGEVQADHLYDIDNPEVILKNFVLEIWSTAQTNQCYNPEALQILSSIMELKSINYGDRDTSDTYEVSTGAEFLNLLNQSTTTTLIDLVSWYSLEASRITIDAIGRVTSIPAYLPSSYNALNLNSQTSTLFSDTELPNYLFPKFSAGYFTAINGETLTPNQILVLLKVLALPGSQSTSIIMGNVTIGFDPAIS